MALQYADRLGYVLNQEEPQLSSARELLNAVEQDGSLEVKHVVNYPLQKYGGRTSVHLAAGSGLWECMELLLKKGGDPNVTSSATDLCQTPLHLAASGGHVRCVQVLLDYHADVERVSSQRLTALDMAKGNPPCERLLEQVVARAKVPCWTEEGNLIMYLHQVVQDPKRQEEAYSLLDRLPEGYLDLSTRKTDFYELTLLTRACNAGSIGVVQYLLSKSPSEPLPCLSKGDTPLLSACRRGDVAMAALLLNHSRGLLFRSDETDRLTPLHVACSRGDLNMVRLLLDHFRLSGCHTPSTGKQLDLNFRDRLGRTPLFNACQWGRGEVVGALLNFAQENKGVVDLDVSLALGDGGRTPLHAAVSWGDLGMVKMLVVAGADVGAEAMPSSHTHRLLLRFFTETRVSSSSTYSNTPPSPGKQKVNVVAPPPGGLPVVFANNVRVGSAQGGSPGQSATPFSFGGSDFAPGSPSGLLDESFFGGLPPEGGTMSPLSRGSGAFVSIDSVLEPMGPHSEDSVPLEVYQTSTGRLEVRPRDHDDKTPLPPGGSDSGGHLVMTPLAEACVRGSREVVRVLLEGGARDGKGLACRVALVAGCPDLARLILSYHVQSFQKKTWSSPRADVAAELELDWSEKRLPRVQGEWFDERASFHVTLHQGEMEELAGQSSVRWCSHLGLARSIVQMEVSSVVIRCIHLQRNCLKEVPLELFRLPAVLTIDLSDNEIAELPVVRVVGRDLGRDHLRSGWRCGQLQKLALGRNRLASLPPCIWSLESLVTLEVGHNCLRSLPQGPEQAGGPLPGGLEEVDVSHNELEMVPRCLFELPCVKTVLLDHNRVESLPESLWLCGSLRELNVSHNRLASLPWCEPEESLMPSQQEAGTGHTALVKNSTKTSGVKVEVVAPIKPGGSKGGGSGAAVPAVQDTPGIAEGCDYSSLLKLDLSHNQLAIFPEALACLAPNLAELDISWNRFETVDVQFVPQSLQKFVAKDCGLKRFGTVLGVDMYWQILKNCRHGLTFGMPCQHRSHRRLPFLSSVFLQRNKLKWFQLLQHPPGERGEDPGEGEVAFSAQASSQDLLYPVLEGLDLSSNDLQGLFNPNIGHQAHLRWIKLDGNQRLERVPMEFAYLKGTRQFTELSLCDLPNLVEPPKEHQQVGLNHLLNYMKSRLKESVQYKTLKIFLIGKAETGKTTLLRRLKNLSHEKVSRTTGIEIEDWCYPEVTKGILKRAPKNAGIHFVVWDCVGQDLYHTLHTCFYSKRSLYLAVFRLTDGPSGVDDLDPWLRNVQFRAPGCPVIVIGTHLDVVTEQKAIDLEKLVQSKYQDTRIYPKVVAVVSLSATKRAAASIDNLRRLILEVSCHLQLSSDGTSLEYKKTMSEDDPRALFQEQIPLSFLELQKAIKKEVTSRSVTGSPPVMMEEEFKKSFSNVCENEDEFQEATNYLHLQGTLLHFEDVALRDVFFLDPQWLTKLLAGLINPSTAANIGSLVKDGVAEASRLLEHSIITPSLSDQYIHLLEKFEVVLKINHTHMIVPSAMPAEAKYPTPQDQAGDTVSQRPLRTLRRLWLSDYVPPGFWPRLICRVAMDGNVGRVLGTVACDGQARVGDESDQGLNWVPWKTGVAYVCGGRTLLVVRQQVNEGRRAGQVRVEVHVHTPEWAALSNEVGGRDPGHTLPLATHLLVMVSHHVVSLALEWFPGMLLGHPTPLVYVPCWKCYEAMDCTTITKGGSPARDDFIFYHNQTMVHCFDVDQCVPPAVLGRELMCVFHNGLEVMDMVPDLIFWDLQYTQKVSNSILRITENEILGKGGYGVVCKGELTVNDRKQNVAVKIFMENMDKLLETKSVLDILKECREPEHLLYSYHQIRQEVSFLSNLNHPNLTELCGVKTQPMCLLLELAPKKSLRAILKEYKDRRLTLEPLSLKVTSKQIADALEYLHDRQIVHLDVKSPNVLVWHFPSATLGRQDRMGQAGNILLKLADYGISQVSTRKTIKVGNNPMGTPGFIAPEMFGTGKEVSADKLDVFAFGMTIYELLSYKAPFENIDPVAKRNHLVKDGQRPSLKGKELRSPLLLQELMVQCWSQNPDDRPQMRDIGRWVSSLEFERLRAQVYLKDVKTLSCACVCRITPEQEVSMAFPLGSFDSSGIVSDVINTSSVQDLCFDNRSMDMCLDDCNSYLPPLSEPLDEQKEELRGPTDDQREGHQEVGQGGIHLQEEVGPRAQKPLFTAGEGVQNQQLLDPYTQIWLCGRDKCKGLVQIFTYHDGHSGSYTFTGYLSQEEVFTVCPVRNTMWVGTTTGKLRVYHAPTLRCEYVGQLTSDKASILDMVHIKEVSAVMVTTSKGDVWVFHDQLCPQGLLIEEQLCLGDVSTIFHFTKVVVCGCLEVWGTTSNSCLIVLEKTRYGWSKLELSCDPGNSKLKVMSSVVHCGFVDANGRRQNHVWASYWSRTVMVSWDAKTRKQRNVFDCAKMFRTATQSKDMESSSNILSLAAHGRKVFVGTSGGSVGVVDSETCAVLKVFAWHHGKVRTLLVMPKEVEGCLCAEVPIGDQGDHTPANQRGAVGDVTSGDPRLAEVEDNMATFPSDNPLYVPNPEPDACMVTSIGNGRRQFAFQKSSATNKAQSDQENAVDDVYLLMWKAHAPPLN